MYNEYGNNFQGKILFKKELPLYTAQQTKASDWETWNSHTVLVGMYVGVHSGKPWKARKRLNLAFP